MMIVIWKVLKKGGRSGKGGEYEEQGSLRTMRKVRKKRTIRGTGGPEKDEVGYEKGD